MNQKDMSNIQKLPVTNHPIDTNQSLKMGETPQLEVWETPQLVCLDIDLTASGSLGVGGDGSGTYSAS